MPAGRRVYLLSAKALDDLSGIWDYSADRWSPEQADTYVRSIDAICLKLANGVLKGQSAEHIRHGYRKQAVGSHMLFFRCLEDGRIEIVRILHQRMDVQRHL